MTAAETYRQTQARLWGSPVPEHLTHGSSWVRGVYGCDCKLCLPSGKRKHKTISEDHRPLTARERQARYRAARLGQPIPPEVRHPSNRAYNIYGCRCEMCRTWHNKKERAKKARRVNRWRETAHGHWRTEVRDGVPMEIICWPPKDAGPDWVCPCKAKERRAA